MCGSDVGYQQRTSAACRVAVVCTTSARRVCPVGDRGAAILGEFARASRRLWRQRGGWRMTSLDLESRKAFIAHIDDSVGLLRDIVDDLVDEAETMESVLIGLGLDTAV